MTMFTRFIETVIGDKKQWRDYKARARSLPPPYNEAIDALERYVMYFGPGDDPVPLLLDLLDLFEQSAADGTPIRQIVGDDPVEFAETFLNNYPKGNWIVRERRRLTDAINQAASR
ncbi:hypothetical protein ACTI_52730 [Actinoplanes sp. OR16]|uniref:DUF1048 domain-containing protein n=1 Tax=Actinoplanes sp. OR16 TaxID=946334 RepID=UPI000F6C497E|nr:DUF1048 domain-containing protein [Actinoplanes sp. OR16]BBH68588.1 hypothetical protein ACTI_52730 [Actinoplanes sp. OR16]